MGNRAKTPKEIPTEPTTIYLNRMSFVKESLRLIILRAFFLLRNCVMAIKFSIFFCTLVITLPIALIGHDVVVGGWVGVGSPAFYPINLVITGGEFRLLAFVSILCGGVVVVPWVFSTSLGASHLIYSMSRLRHNQSIDE